MLTMKRSGLFASLGLVAILASACVIESNTGTPDPNPGTNPGDGQDAGGGGGDTDTDGGGGDTDTDGGGGGGGDIDYPANYSEECGEAAANTTRDKAVGMGQKVQICLAEGQERWFKVEAPKTGGAYLLKVSYVQEDDARFQARAVADADKSEISYHTADKGTSSSFAVSVGAGTTTYLKFNDYYGTGKVNMAFEIQAENDAYEPNDSKDDSAAVNLNEDIKGQLWIPYVSAASQVSDDWFKVDLAVGEVTIKLATVPENMRVKFSVVGPTGKNVDYGTSDNVGAQLTWKFNVEDAGTHYIKLEDHYSSKLGPFFEATLPKTISEQYSFRIEQ